MKLEDWQAGPIASAVQNYIEYVINRDEYKEDDIHNDCKNELESMARSNLYETLCMFFQTGAPDPEIEFNLMTGKWTDHTQVIKYIEATY